MTETTNGVCGLYVRVSTLGQKDNFSVATQIQEGIEFATKNGWAFQVYQEAESGTSMEARNKFLELIEDIKSCKVTKVWVINQDRLNRNSVDAATIKSVFTKYKIELYERGNLQRFEKASDRLGYNTKAAVAEYVRDTIVENSVRSKTEWQNSGYMALPNVYGYSFVYQQNGEKLWSINEKEAKVIKLIYKLYVEDRLPFNQIARKLNDSGYKTKKGYEWARNQVRSILTQTLYIGKSWKTTGEPIDSKIYMPIIDDELFQKAQAIIASTTNVRNKFKSRKATSELTGMIHCASCGAPYFFNQNFKVLKDGTRREWQRYYHSIAFTKYKTCEDRKGIDKRKTELIIENVIRDEFFENEDKFIKWWKSYQAKTGLQIDQLKKAITGYEEKKALEEKKRDTILEAIATGDIERQAAKNILSKYSEQISSIDSEISKLKLELSQQTSAINDEVYKAISDLTHNFENLTVVQKRGLYKMIFQSITIEKNRLTIQMYDGRLVKKLVPVLGTIGKRRHQYAQTTNED